MLISDMGEKKRILIIEDEVMLSDLYKHMLEKQLFEIRTLSNPLEAIPTIQTFKPDLILLDIMLPEMNGIELLSKLKTDPTTKDVPVFITTNVAEEESLTRSLDLGAEEFLTKSEFTPQGIVEHIQQYFRDHTDQ